MSKNPLANDLDYVIKETEPLWDELRDQNIFITGGTGFFGCWLLESFIWANTKLQLNASAVILTRNKAQFEKKCPHLFHHPALRFHDGDIRDFEFPKDKFSHIIHAATDASVHLNESNPLLMLDTILKGTKRVLEFTKICGAKRFLLTSSGAVYGKQPTNVTHLSENDACQPEITDSKSAYAIGKCTAEHMSCLFGKQYGFDVKIARCFAFLGPYLPLDIHYAIGNFIRDGLGGGPIIVQGDGTPYRSYLYAADLAIWLWTILFKGKSFHPYNVGSNKAYSIVEVANRVAHNFESIPEVKVMKQPSSNALPMRYVPDITRAEKELQLSPQISLDEAICLTKKWCLAKQEYTSTVEYE